MNSNTTKRPMLESERDFLHQVLQNSKGNTARWIRGSENVLVLWAVFTLLFILTWWVITWVTRITFHVDIGWHSPAALWIAALGTIISASYAVVSTVRWIRSWPNIRQDILADLEEGQVIEETYAFSAVKRFQEPEHGGLFYFLRTTDDKVMMLYDEESQDIGVQGEDPLKSKFQPCVNLLMIRAPRTQLVISKRFAGTTLDAGIPHELSLPPESWPETDTFCKIRWDDLEKRLSRKNKKN